MSGKSMNSMSDKSQLQMCRYRSDHWGNGSEDEGTRGEHHSGSENVGVACVLNWISISIWIGVFFHVLHLGDELLHQLRSWSYVSRGCWQVSFMSRKSAWLIAFLARLDASSCASSCVVNINRAAETLIAFIQGGVINMLFEPIVDFFIISIPCWNRNLTSCNFGTKSITFKETIDFVSCACWALGGILSSGRLEGCSSKESDVGNILHKFLNFRIN